MLRDVLRTTGVQLVQLFGGIAALALTARLLGPEGRGVFGTVVVLAGLFAACGGLSLESVVLNRASRGRGDDWFAPLLASMCRLYGLLLAAVLSVALLLAAVAREAVFGALPDGALLAGLLLVPALLWGRYQAALLLALGRLDLANAAVLLSWTATLGGLCLFVWALGWGVYGALLAHGLGALLTAGWGLGALLRAARGGASPAAGETAALARDGAKIHTATVGHSFYGSVDVVTLNSVAGPAAVGWYQLALRLATVGAALAAAVATVFRARMAGRSPREAWREQRRPVAWTLAATLAGGALGWWLAPWLVPLVAGEAFAPSVELFRALLPVLLARSLELLIVPQVFARGLFLTGSLIAVVMAAVSAGLFLWLVPLAGLEGAVTAALLAFAALPLAIYLGWIWWFERDLRRALREGGDGRGRA